MNPAKNKIHSDTALHVPIETTTPLLVADGIHILRKQVYQAIINRDAELLASLVHEQMATGAMALAVNLGPGKKMEKLTGWVVDTVMETTDKPLFFSANVMGNDQVMQMHGPAITINAVTADQKDLKLALQTAGKYNCSLVVLLVRSGMMTSGIEERIRLASQVIEQAMLQGFPLSRLYLDPVLSCHPDPQAWRISRGFPDVGTAVETIGLISQLDDQVKTIVAMGNVSTGSTIQKKKAFHARILPVLVEAGVDAILLDCRDLDAFQIVELTH